MRPSPQAGSHTVRPVEINVLGERIDDPVRRRIEIALDAGIAGLVLTHARPRGGSERAVSSQTLGEIH
jgi:hypothetical protein